MRCRERMEADVADRNASVLARSTECLNRGRILRHDISGNRP